MATKPWFPGGQGNEAKGRASFAAGYYAHALYDGSFVWADCSDNTPFKSTGYNQFLIRANGGVGINTNNPRGYALNVNGSILCASLNQASDARYKRNIALLENPLDTILNLRGVSYEWDREQWKERDFAAGRQIGFIAQEVEKILPELVTTDEKGYKSVAYANVVPILVEAVKAQQKQIEALQKTNAAIQAEKEELHARMKRYEDLEARLKALEALQLRNENNRK